jgi:mono/diheme cytochrome c family protein
MKKALKVVGFVVLGLVGLVAVAVAYAGLTASGRLQFPDTAAPKLKAVSDPAIIEQGRYLVHGPAHCSQCHSTDDRSHPEKVKDAPLRGGLSFAMGPLGTRYAVNLTPHETGIGKLSDEQLARTIRTGVLHDGELSFFMRIAAANPSEEDTVAIMSYLRSLQPIANQVPQGEWYLFGKVLLTYAFPKLEPRQGPAPKHVPASDTPSLERGKYLAHNVMKCIDCHSKADMSKSFDPIEPLAGGSNPDPSHGDDDKDMEFVAPNLTSHPTGITGRMDEAAFVARLRAGRAFKSSIMPWEGFAATSESDLKSVYMYLKSLPPVDNDVGATYRRKGQSAGK